MFAFWRVGRRRCRTCVKRMHLEQHGDAPCLSNNTAGNKTEAFDAQVSKKGAWAPGDEGEFLSASHGQWCKCRIVDCRGADGAVQINLKPGQWLSEDVQEQRLRARGHAPRRQVLADLMARAISVLDAPRTELAPVVAAALAGGLRRRACDSSTAASDATGPGASTQESKRRRLARPDPYMPTAPMAPAYVDTRVEETISQSVAAAGGRMVPHVSTAPQSGSAEVGAEPAVVLPFDESNMGVSAAEA